MPAGAVRSALARVSLTRALVALGLLLVAINVGDAIWDTRAERMRTERRAQRDFANLTSLLAQQTAASLHAADLIMREAQRAGAAPQAAAAVPRLRDELFHMPQIAALLVMDTRGEIIARTDELPSIDPDLAARRLFTAHRDGEADGLFVSHPFLGGPVATSWRFILSRRLSGPGGRFGGVIAAVIEVEAFDRLYRSIDLGEGGLIALHSVDGMLITRVPEPPEARGQPLGSPEIVAAVHREGRFDGWTTSPVLHQPVLLSAAAVPGFPLFVASGSAQRSVLAPWREQAWLIGIRSLVTSAAMMALIGLAAWGLARREQALQRSEKRFRAMIERSADGVVLMHPQSGAIFYASPGFERVTGYRFEEVRDRPAFDLLDPEHRESVQRLRDEMLGTPGKVVTHEYRIRHHDGSWRWVEGTLSNLLHEPSVRAVVANVRDITERKLAEAERARLEQRLRQAEKMEAVGRLAGGIAHDFNNILGGILGYAEMLVETAAEGSPQRRYAQNVLTAANRASGLVEQILSYSRSQRGKRVPVELDRIVAETLDLVRGKLVGRISLEARLPAKPVFVIGDATQLHQIVMNLCTNAVHAMGETGTLHVTVDAEEVAAERVFAHTTLRPGSYARLAVEDSGSGMEATTLARLFEPFFTTKEIGKGTGLGLSLVYGIVTDSAGAIDVASSVGRGSRFTIYLPRVDSPAIAEDATQAPATRGNGEHVMVVEDEKPLMALICEVLKRLGYEPTGFADGKTALAEFEAGPGRFDALITDEVMPGLAGTDLAAALRRKRADLPVVLVSGYIGPMMRERATAAGIREILKKPVQTRELAAALARALGRA
ncbi:MAG: PAS domain S-box protein [Betaproteobacteria bacterium]|nr:MAG: PAS domain S-box protein [Betaproteobacteria bacterium]